MLVPAPDTQAGMVGEPAAVAEALHGDSRPERGALESDPIPAVELGGEGAGAKPAGFFVELDLKIRVDHRELRAAVAPPQVASHECVGVAAAAELDVACDGVGGEEQEGHGEALLLERDWRPGDRLANPDARPHAP